MKPVFGLALSTLCVVAAQVQAGSGFCEVLTGLKTAAVTGDRQNLHVAFPNAEAMATDCGLVRELGGARAVFCTWEFAYREEAAEAAFAVLTAQVKACRGDPISAEAPVNHPDSYELLTFEDGASVGLKDKVGLGETHVILRVQS